MEEEISALRVANTYIMRELGATEKKLVRREKEVRKLQRETRYDPLTASLNRKAMEEDLSAEFARCSRYGWPIAIIMADIDDFKRVNDTHG